MRDAILSADSDEADWSDDSGDGVWRMSGCTIRLGEYVLITEAAPGVQMTWDCYFQKVIVSLFCRLATVGISNPAIM